MPPAVRFVFVIHDHQPVGNFDGVFEQALHDAYEPLLDLLDRHLGPLTQTETLLSTHENTQHGLHITNDDVVIWGRVD